MTVMIVKQFLELFEQDQTLQTQLVIYDPEDFDDLVDFAVAKGYVFSKDELLAALDEYAEGALSHHMRVWTR
ncbi:MAG: Nif11-like leader peptide family natural product precursor [Chloroflexota bacterium]